jgi:hypothetical protein
MCAWNNFKRFEENIWPLYIHLLQTLNKFYIIAKRKFKQWCSIIIKLTRAPLVKQELLTLPGHLSSSPIFGGVRVTRSFVLCVCFVDSCLSFCSFSFGHYVVSPTSIYWSWLPLWYLQTLQNLDYHHCIYRYKCWINIP